MKRYSKWIKESPASVPARIATGLFVLFGLCAARAADTNTPVVVNGFNRDVVIENTSTGPPYSTALELNPGENTAFYQTNLAGKIHGMPLTGLFTNASDGTVFQLQPYTASNALTLSSDTGIASGTLFLATPKVYNSIAILANSGNGDSTGTASLTLHFNDGSTVVTNYFAPDWFNNAATANYSIALQGVERINLTSGAVSGAPTNPRFYQTTLSLTNLLGVNNKPLSSITFGKATGSLNGQANSTGIYAVSGATNPSQGSIVFSLATITNLPATSLQTTGAVLNGQVISTGNDAPVVAVFYGPADGGTNSLAWSNSVVLGWQTGVFAQPVSGLTFSTTYFFTARAVNVAGTAWAKASKTFTTPAPSLATVTNLPATSVLANSASLSGQVLSTGGDMPSVTIYYGPANGGTSPAAWSNSVALGLQGGSFVKGVFGLSSNTTYFFTASAANGAGTAWATPSKSFTTLNTNPVVPPAAVLTHHNDNGRTGMNLNETILNISNVNTNTFGLVSVRMVDDQVYAQPLVATNVSIPGKGSHNILCVCTVNDSVYAFDADDPTVAAPYWQTNFLGIVNGTNLLAPRNSDMTSACGGNYQDFSGAFGIVGTPVIDPLTKTMWLVVRTKETTATSTNFVQRLRALDITTGAERTNAMITASVSGNASDGSGGMVSFNPQHNNQRPGLVLANGIVYVAWTSHCDWTPYHGWVIAYNSTNLQQLAAYCDTPNGTQGGIWMSGQAPAADTNGNIYVSTGNGTVDTLPAGATNRSQSFLKLNSTNLSVMSWFTPFNYSSLNGGDLDLGSGGVLLIPGTNLFFSGGKGGEAYLVNRDNMGALSTGTADTNILQSFQVTSDEIHGGPAWWDGPDGSYGYLWPSSTYLQQYKFNRASGLFMLPAYAQDQTVAPNGQPGGILSLSANGTNAGSGIVWAAVQLVGDANQATRPGILHAYDAQSVASELWNSQQLPARDAVGGFAKFVPPTEANGKVYLATFSDRINVYGLLPAGPPLLFQQPQSATRYAADAITFSVWAGGSIAPLTYQWMFNGSTVIPGATNASYTLSNVQFPNVGNYSCIVSNDYGPVTSSNASLTVVSAPMITYAQIVMADNPMAYWRLDESSGTVAHDYWGGFNGQYTNAQLSLPGYNPLDPDTAAGFGSLSTNESYAGNIAIDFSTLDAATFSVEAWASGSPQSNDNGIVAKGSGGGGEQFDLDTGTHSGANHFFRFFVRDDGGGTHLANGTVGPDGNWHHLAGVCDEVGGFVYLYVDGVLNASAAVSGGILSTMVPVSIGSRKSGQSTPYDLNFIGTIDEVAIYNYALSPAQVQLHYSVGTNGPVVITARSSNGKVILTWPLGTLQSATNVTGPYSDVTNGIPPVPSPYTNAPSGPQQFYRVRVR